MGKTTVSEKREKGERNINDKVETQGSSLPEKVFAERDSLITDLYKDKNIRSIYNFFLAILFGLIISTVLNDLFGTNGEKSSILLLRKSFGKFPLAVLIWVSQLASTFFAFYCFNFWAKIRTQLLPKSTIVKIWDQFCVSLVAFYYLFSFYLLSKVVVVYKIPSASAALILIEGTRLLMKVHAFIRNSAPEVLRYKPHAERDVVQKKFSKFVYFLFAPTLIYCDEYPRTKQIRWWYVLQCVVEVFGEIFFCSIICTHILIPNFEDFGRRKYTWTEVALKIFANVPAGMLTPLLLFYCVLHSWQNAFAELLRFGDRLFYKDWWTSTTYSRFYRTWNVVVHDWLYTYIYKDMHDHIMPRNKFVAKLTVMFVSGVVHEYLLTIILSQFCPILFIEFCVLGTMFFAIRVPDNSMWNILFLYSHGFGSFIQLAFYTLEKRARINKPVENETLVEFLMPRMLTCDCFE